jgi:hypothetical protein
MKFRHTIDLAQYRPRPTRPDGNFTTDEVFSHLKALTDDEAQQIDLERKIEEIYKRNRDVSTPRPRTGCGGRYDLRASGGVYPRRPEDRRDEPGGAPHPAIRE